MTVAWTCFWASKVCQSARSAHTQTPPTARRPQRIPNEAGDQIDDEIIDKRRSALGPATRTRNDEAPRCNQAHADGAGERGRDQPVLKRGTPISVREERLKMRHCELLTRGPT